MELNERQIRILTGEICPYCGRESELVDVGKIYGRKDLGLARMCRSCNAWVEIHKDGPDKGKARGRLADPSLRSLKSRVRAELDHLWNTSIEESKMYDALSEVLNIPREYTSIDMLGERSMSNVLSFCMTYKEMSGSNIGWYRTGEKCPNKNGQIVCGTGACRGCPEYIHDDKDGYVWCDPDMSYGKIKDINILRKCDTDSNITKE